MGDAVAVSSMSSAKADSGMMPHIMTHASNRLKIRFIIIPHFLKFLSFQNLILL